MRYPLTALFFFLSPVPASASHSSNFQVHPSTPPLRIQWSGFLRSGAEPECHSFICEISATRDPSGTPSNRFSGFAGLKSSALKAEISGRASVLPGTADSRGIEIFVLSTQQISAAVPEGTRVRVSISGGLGGSEGDPRTTSVNIFATTFPHRRPGVSFGLGNFSTSYIVLSGPLSPPINGLQFGPVDGFSFQGGINIGGLQPEGASHQSSFGGSFRMELEFLGKALRGVSGNGQTGSVKSELADPLVVKVLDTETGRPVVGQTVSFSVVSSPTGAEGAESARVVPGEVDTSTEGFASARMTLGGAGGTYTVRAFCGECIQDKEVLFELMAKKPAIDLKVTLFPSEVFPSGIISATEGPNFTLVEVKATGEPEAIANQKILLRAKEVPSSGGHAHGAPPTRPLGIFSSDDCTTDANGKCTADYRASEFGGEEIIEARLAEDAGVKSDAPLEVNVPSLGPLPPAAEYELTGQTSSHPDNHNGKEELITAIAGITDEYFILTGKRLGINDMSLPSGGRFDIAGDWLGSYEFHREGKTVSIEPKLVGIEKLLLFTIDLIAFNHKLILVNENPRKCPDCVHFELR